MPQDPEEESQVAGRVNDHSWPRTRKPKSLCMLQTLVVPNSPPAFVSLCIWKELESSSRKLMLPLQDAVGEEVGLVNVT